MQKVALEASLEQTPLCFGPRMDAKRIDVNSTELQIGRDRIKWNIMGCLTFRRMWDGLRLAAPYNEKMCGRFNVVLTAGKVKLTSLKSDAIAAFKVYETNLLSRAS